MNATIEKRWALKRDHLKILNQNLGKLQKQVSQDLKSSNGETTRLTALAVRLMLLTSERVGNVASAKVGHYGVTTWLWSHTMLKNSYVVFRYVAKSGVVQVKEVSDMESVAFLKAQRDKRTPSVFTASNGQKVSAKMVNAYLQEFGITSKDIRTWNANTLLTKSGASCDNLKAVAQTIGNQPNTLKNNYILPETAKGIDCKKKKK